MHYSMKICFNFTTNFSLFTDKNFRLRFARLLMNNSYLLFLSYRFECKTLSLDLKCFYFYRSHLWLLVNDESKLFRLFDVLITRERSGNGGYADTTEHHEVEPTMASAAQGFTAESIQIPLQIPINKLQ